MNEMELVSLSEEIRDSELSILERKESYLRSELAFEIAISAYITQLELDYPDLCVRGMELSTVEKRRFKAESDPVFVTQKRELESYKRDTQMMEILLDHKKRVFSIYRKV